MITYEPEDIKGRIFAVLEGLDFLSGDIEDIKFDCFLDESAIDDYDAVICDESEVCLYIGEDNYPTTTLGYFLDMCESINESKLNDDQSYAKSPNEADFLLAINDYNTLMLLEGLERSSNTVKRRLPTGIELWGTEIEINKTTYRIALFKGLCIYHILVEKSGNVDKYYPSYSENDYFIRITSADKIELAVADSLAVSFAFELHSTHKLIFDFSSGRPDPEEIYYDEDELSKRSFPTFPLLYGRGIKEVLSLYNKAIVATDFDQRILCFTKVLEYISPTIAQGNLYEAVSLKLSSATVLSPTSEYINELGKIFAQNQSDIGKDVELIKLAIMTVADLNEIWKDVPFLFKETKKKGFSTLDDSEKMKCFEALSASVYATRNEIAHAKANYAKTGTECPEKDKEQFCNALEKIAIRCIRWFALQPENKRVILP